MVIYQPLIPFLRLHVQPITEFTLTTMPTVRANEGGGWGLTENDLREDLHSRWPSVKTWNLPQEAAGPRYNGLYHYLTDLGRVAQQAALDG